MLCSLNYDDLSFGVFGLVEAGVSRIGDVDSCVNLVVHDTTNEGDGPLGCIVAHDGDSGPILTVKLVTSLRESHRFMIVLVPSPALLDIIALDPDCRSVTT